ncbi:hypothetical protein CVV68_01915 [Arthrobacter livingstonensis]|uniref:Dehydrogenase n=1 Tax=Arthrobacter livingstonensis TaxID=670078 RepID=A0A2V5M069_9MICC|nr:hypothetical protein [Arthrobacter livingstonensis]PYI69877.1 hypothetical protein CVV68_01915 [Arthrobacter livingstonensis]
MLKGLLGASRQGRRDDAELGKGVWRRAHDRFRRGLDRFHQMLEGVADDAAHPAPAAEAGQDQGQPGARPVGNGPAENYAALVPIANALADLLPVVRTIAAQAHAIAPSEGMEIPTGTGGYLNDVHRELSRAGNALATAAEAAAMVRLGAGEVSGVERRAGLVHEHVNRAAELLAKK